MPTLPHQLAKVNSLGTAIASILLFLSGVAALIYQTLWVKQLALVVGVDVYALTIGVSAFFAGLAIGNFGFGRQADRVENPLQLYAGLELGIAVAGIGATRILAAADRPFVFWQDTVGIFAWLLPFLLVGLPATLMGGTLVVLLRACQPPEEGLGRTSGFLYAANTAGAIAGTLATAFLCIPSLGLQRTAWIAAGINLGLAIAAFACQRIYPSNASMQQHPSREVRYVPLTLGIYTVAGGIALGYEAFWTQAIVQFLSTRVYAFAVVLAVYLLGLTLGSWLTSYWSDRVANPWPIFGLLLAGAGVSAFGIVASINPWLLKMQYWGGQLALQATHSPMMMKLATFGVAAGVFVLLPTILLGAAYPFAIRLAVRGDRMGGDAGRVTALNTSGGILGIGITGFVLIPKLGLVHSLAVLASLAVFLGAIAIVRGSKQLGFPIGAGIVAIAFVGLTLFVPADKFARLLTLQHRGELVFYEESAGATVAVVEQPTPRGSFHRLYIQGVSNTGDAMPSLRYMRLQALLPLIIHQGEPKSALVVGLGSGITSGALLAYPHLEKRIAVELLPAVVAASAIFDGNFNVARHPEITLQVGDGRHELLRTRKLFDLITLEPPPPSAAGVVNLYSRDFYELCKDKLAPNGLLAQWWPLATQNDEDSRSLVRSLLDAFPYVSLWSTELHEMLVIGSMSPLTLDPEQIRDRYEQPTVKAALSEVGISSPQALLATYVTDGAGLEQYVKNAPPITDDRPLIEYADWVRSGEFARVLPRVMGHNTPVPLAESDPWRVEIEKEQYNLWNFYQAGLAAYRGDRDRWYRLMMQVSQSDPDNPYYQWFFQRSD